MSFNSPAEILDAFRELQEAADQFEVGVKSRSLELEAVERRADDLQRAFQKFAFMMRTSP